MVVDNFFYFHATTQKHNFAQHHCAGVCVFSSLRFRGRHLRGPSIKRAASGNRTGQCGCHAAYVGRTQQVSHMERDRWHHALRPPHLIARRPHVRHVAMALALHQRFVGVGHARDGGAQKQQ